MGKNSGPAVRGRAAPHPGHGQRITAGLRSAPHFVRRLALRATSSLVTPLAEEQERKRRALTAGS